MESLAAEPQSATELATSIGIHPRTARRVLRRLADEGYVTLVPGRRRRWRPTLRVVALAGLVIARDELANIALPHIAALHSDVGETCHLCSPSYLSALCLVHVGYEGPNGHGPQLRELVPAHATASGKALLAWRDGWREAVLEQPLKPYTERTLTGPNYLRRELARTEARGWAFEDREYQPDARAIAVPVISRSAEAVAAVAVVAPLSRLPTEWSGELAEMVGRTAQAIAAELSH
ncbi:MAG: IclR family transcriptional regulator, regulon repressor [Thermoleophilaceae bacterium]|jgi:IclR family acetate operon transcriptional repressor|nr:IclR family transcriptional regulator, regulon repressor [Thermoleophilaceae bacterium]